MSSFKGFLVYQKAFSLAREIYEIAKTLPREEKYSLTDQIRRSFGLFVLILQRRVEKGYMCLISGRCHRIVMVEMPKLKFGWISP